MRDMLVSDPIGSLTPVLRRAAQRDIPALADLVRGAYAPWVLFVGCTPEPIAADLAAVVREAVYGRAGYARTQPEDRGDRAMGHMAKRLGTGRDA